MRKIVFDKSLHIKRSEQKEKSQFSFFRKNKKNIIP